MGLKTQNGQSIGNTERQLSQLSLAFSLSLSEEPGKSMKENSHSLSLSLSWLELLKTQKLHALVPDH